MMNDPVGASHEHASDQDRNRPQGWTDKSRMNASFLQVMDIAVDSIRKGYVDNERQSHKQKRSHGEIAKTCVGEADVHSNPLKGDVTFLPCKWSIFPKGQYNIL
jgi:hypothetical protein